MEQDLNALWKSSGPEGQPPSQYKTMSERGSFAQSADYSVSEKGELPVPSVSPTPRRSTAPSQLRRLAIAVGSLLIFGYLFGNPFANLRGDLHPATTPNDRPGNLYGLVGTNGISTSKKHDKHKGKHGSKHHKGKGGKGGKGKKHGPQCDHVQNIYPNKKIEEVYLSIPTNDSARE